jgi:hypothetical protein
VVSVSGNLSNAPAPATGGSGPARLTMTSGRAQPVIILDAGNNTIRLSPTDGAGLPNVDFLDVGTGP